MPAAQLRPWLCLGWARTCLRSPAHWVGLTLTAALVPLLGVLSLYGALPLRGALTVDLVEDAAWMGAVAGVTSGLSWLARAEGFLGGLGSWSRWWQEWVLVSVAALVGATAAVLTAPEPWSAALGASLRAGALGLVARKSLRGGSTAPWALVAVAVFLPAAGIPALGESWLAQFASFLVTPRLDAGALAANLGLLVIAVPGRGR